VAANVASELANQGVTVSSVGAVAAPTIEAKLKLRVRADAVSFKSKADIVASLNTALSSPTLTDSIAKAGITVDKVTVVDAWAPVSGYPPPPPPPPSPSPPPADVPKKKDNTQLYIIAGACSGGGLFLGLVAFGIWYATRKNAAAMKAKMKGGYSDDPGGTRFDPFRGAGGAAAKKQAERASKKAAWEKKRRGDSLAAIAPGGGADVEGGRGGSMFGGFGRNKHSKVSPLKGPVVSKPVRGSKAPKAGLRSGQSVANIGTAEQTMRAQHADAAADRGRDREQQFVPEKAIDASFVWEGASTRGGGGGGRWDGQQGEFGTGPKGTA
jgi:hypothetical protein